MRSKLILYLLPIFFLIVGYRSYLKDVDSNILSQELLGGIVPHHLFVSDIIAQFFREISIVSPDNIIILGPNHLEAGSAPITTNSKYFLDNIHNPLVNYDPSIVENDQSITSILPYASKTFPKSKLIPLVLKYSISLENCQQLAEVIANLPGKNLVIASIDFSHYLNTSQALKNDQITLALIKNRAYQDILSLDSGFLDSPASLVTALLYFDHMGKNDMKILQAANSGQRGNQYAETTSYFSIVYTKVHGKNE